MGRSSFARQYGAALLKNWRLKRASWKATLAELLIPVIAMALLTLLKSISTDYDSPNVAYACGPAASFMSADESLVCTAKPA